MYLRMYQLALLIQFGRDPNTPASALTPGIQLPIAIAIAGLALLHY